MPDENCRCQNSTQECVGGCGSREGNFCNYNWQCRGGGGKDGKKVGPGTAPAKQGSPKSGDTLKDTLKRRNPTSGEVGMLCRERRACNFNQEGQCIYDCYGCTDSRASNYNPRSTRACDGNYGGYCGDVVGANCCCIFTDPTDPNDGGSRDTGVVISRNEGRVKAGSPASMGWPPLDYNILPGLMQGCEDNDECCSDLCSHLSDTEYSQCFDNCVEGGLMYGAQINWHPMAGEGNYMWSWRGTDQGDQQSTTWGSWSCDYLGTASTSCHRNNLAWVFPSINTCSNDDFDWMTEDWSTCLSPLNTSGMMMENSIPSTVLYFYESEFSNGIATGDGIAPGLPAVPGTYNSSKAHIIHSSFQGDQFPASHHIPVTAPNEASFMPDEYAIETIPVPSAQFDFTNAFFGNSDNWEFNPLDPCPESGTPGCGNKCKEAPFNQNTYWLGDGCFRGSFFRTFTIDETPFVEMDYEITVIDTSNNDWAPNETDDNSNGCLQARGYKEKVHPGEGGLKWHTNQWGTTCHIPSGCPAAMEQQTGGYITTTGIQPVFDYDHPFNQPCSATNNTRGSTAFGQGYDLFNAWWCNVDLVGLGGQEGDQDIPINLEIDSADINLMIHYNAWDGLSRWFGVYPDYTAKRIGWAWTDTDGDGLPDSPAFDDNGNRLPDLFGRHLHEVDAFYQEWSMGHNGGLGICMEYFTDPDSEWSTIYDYGNAIPHAYRYGPDQAGRCACPWDGISDHECYPDEPGNPCSGMLSYDGNCCCRHVDAPANTPPPLFAGRATGMAPEGYGSWLSDQQGTTIEPSDPWLTTLAGSAMWMKGASGNPVTDDVSGFDEIIEKYEIDLAAGAETFITLRPGDVSSNEHKWSHYSGEEIQTDYEPKAGDACVCPGGPGSQTTLSNIPKRLGIGEWEWEDISGDTSGRCIFDCAGQCVEAAYVMNKKYGVGDGYCDDNISRLMSGEHTQFNYLAPDCGSWSGVCLNCEAFAWDGGDCNEVSTPEHPHGTGFYEDGGNTARPVMAGHQPGPCLCGHQNDSEASQYNIINTMPYGMCAWYCGPGGCTGDELGWATSWWSGDTCICETMDGDLVPGGAEGGWDPGNPGWLYWSTCTMSNIHRYAETCGDPYGQPGTGGNPRCQYNFPGGWSYECCEYEEAQGSSCLECAREHYDAGMTWIEFGEVWGWWMERYVTRDAADPTVLASDCRGCHAYSGRIRKDCSFFQSSGDIGDTEIPDGAVEEYLKFGICTEQGEWGCWPIPMMLQPDGTWLCPDLNCDAFPEVQSACASRLDSGIGNGIGGRDRRLRMTKTQMPQRRKTSVKLGKGIDGIRGKSTPVANQFRPDDVDFYVFKIIGVTSLEPAGFTGSSALTLEPYIRGLYGQDINGNMNWNTEILQGLTILSNRNHPGFTPDVYPWSPDGEYEGVVCSECAPSENASLNCVLACGNWYSQGQYCGTDEAAADGDAWMCNTQSWHWWLSEAYVEGYVTEDPLNGFETKEINTASIGGLKIMSPEGVTYEVPGIGEIPDVDWTGDYSILQGAGASWASPVAWQVQSNPNCHHLNTEQNQTDDGMTYLTGGAEVILEITDNGQICNSMDSPFPPPVGYWAVNFNVEGEASDEYYEAFEWGQTLKTLTGSGDKFSWGHWACFYPPHWEVPSISDYAMWGDPEDNIFGNSVADWAQAWCEGNNCSDNPPIICPNNTDNDHLDPGSIDGGYGECLDGTPCWAKWCSDAGPTVMPPFANGTNDRIGDRVGGVKLLNAASVVNKYMGYNGETNPEDLALLWEAWIKNGGGPEGFEAYGDPGADGSGYPTWTNFQGTDTFYGRDYPFGRAEFTRFKFRLGVPEGGISYEGRSGRSTSRDTCSHLIFKCETGSTCNGDAGDGVWYSASEYPYYDHSLFNCDADLQQTIGNVTSIKAVCNSDMGGTYNVSICTQPSGNMWCDYPGDFDNPDYVNGDDACTQTVRDEVPAGGLGIGRQIPYSGDIFGYGQITPSPKPIPTHANCWTPGEFGCAVGTGVPIAMMGEHQLETGDIYIQQFDGSYQFWMWDAGNALLEGSWSGINGSTESGIPFNGSITGSIISAIISEIANNIESYGATGWIHQGDQDPNLETRWGDDLTEARQIGWCDCKGKCHPGDETGPFTDWLDNPNWGVACQSDALDCAGGTCPSNSGGFSIYGGMCLSQAPHNETGWMYAQSCQLNACGDNGQHCLFFSCHDQDACNYDPSGWWHAPNLCRYPNEYCDCDGNWQDGQPETVGCPDWAYPCEVCSCWGTVDYGCGCTNQMPYSDGSCPGDGLNDCQVCCHPTDNPCPAGMRCDCCPQEDGGCFPCGNNQCGCTRRPVGPGCSNIEM